MLLDKRNDEVKSEMKKEKMRELYEKSNLSYTNLSVLLGVNRSTLARWLNGTRIPNDITVEYVERKVNEHLKSLEEN